MPEEEEDWIAKILRENRPKAGVIPEPTGPDLNVGETRRSLGVPPAADKPFQSDFVSRNFRGIPIDLDKQSSSELKAKILMREKPEDRLALLEELAGKGNVRLADNGEPLVTIWDPEKKTPVEFRPLGGGANVIPHAVALIPETVGTLASMAATKRIPGMAKAGKFYQAAAEMIGAGVGEQAGGAAKDIAVSSTPLGEILEERAGRVPTSAALNLAIGGAANLTGKVGGKIISPFGGVKGEVEAGTAEAVDYFKNKFGIDYPLTQGEMIGSPLFKRVEATMSRQPGSSANFAKIQRQKVEALRQIQSKILSGKVDPSDVGMLRKLEEDVGEEAINAIRQNVQPLQRAEEMARSNTALAANEAIMDELAQAAGPARQLYPERVGAQMRAGAFGKRMAFENESQRLYGQAYELPGGTTKIIEPPNLASDARKLLGEQPSADVTTMVPTGRVGPSGQPIVSAATQRVPLNEFVPEGIMPILKRLSSLNRAKFSLQDLVKMRTTVRNNIKQGEAVAGVDTHYLGEIEDLLTKSINEGTQALPTGELRDAWKKANDFYAKNVAQFKEKNVSKLFRDNQTGAFVQDEDLVRNIGPTEYKAYKDFFGATSPEFGSLKRALVDSLLPGDELINAKQFLSNLRGFTQKNRSVAEDILGPQTTRNLQAIGEKMEQVQAGDLVERDDIANLLIGANKNKLLQNLDGLVDAQRKLNTAYRSKIIKDIAEGKLGQQFDAGEFVNRMWDTASVGEIKAIKGQLANNPEIIDDLQRKAAERIFHQSQRAAAPGEAARTAAGEPFHAGKASSVERVFGTEENKQRLKELIGEERMQDFEQLAKLLRGGEAAESAFAGSGGFAAQQQIQRMLRGGLFSYLPQWAEQKLVASLYFLTPVRAILTNQIGRNPQAQAAAVRAAVLSQPFMSAMAEDFGDKSSTFIDKILDSVDMFEAQGRPGKAAVGKQDWVEQLIREADKTNPNRQRVFPIQ